VIARLAMTTGAGLIYLVSLRFVATPFVSAAIIIGPGLLGGPRASSSPLRRAGD
jgi:hypothetical protein